MANTYTQLFVHYIFAVQNRQCLIRNEWKDSLYKYITGIINQQGNKLYVINGVQNHLHILVSMSPHQSPSDLMYNVKRSSSLWINQNKFTIGRFSWQEGFGAFSVGKNQVNNIISYIENQQEHHKKFSFREEYFKFLDEYGVEYNPAFTFEPVE